MLIPHKQRKLLRKYEHALFYGDQPLSDRVYTFYLLLSPIIKWIRPELRKLNLEEHEIDSEIYILAHQIFKQYDRSKSSIIPYLEKQTPWFISKLMKRLEKSYKHNNISQLPEEGSYKIQEEFYWRLPDILFCDKFVPKYLSRGQKYIMFIILAADGKELLQCNLAKATNIERKRMGKMLQGLRKVLTEE